MNTLLTLLAVAFAFLALGQSFMIDTPEYGDNVMVDYAMPKRSFQHIWRNIQMQMPSGQNMKRTESLSRARANAYYRLG